MLVEIWSDVVCPWCYIGKARFEQALTGFRHRDEVEVVYRSFELDPTAPSQPSETVLEALGRKYGGGPAAARRMVEQITEVAAELGLRFDFADAPHATTFDAHRLLHLALAEGGPQLQGRLNEAVMEAYFGRAASTADPQVLTGAAAAVRLDTARVSRMLATDEYADAVRADVDQARAFGITGVPFFVVDRRYAVSGAQPVEVFTSLLEHADADHHRPVPVAGAVAGAVAGVDNACGPDGCPVPAAG